MQCGATGRGTQVCNFKQLCKTCVASQIANLKTAYITMPIQDNDPENYKRPRWDPSLLEDEDDDDIVDDDSDDSDTEEDEDSQSSSDDEEARTERNQRLRTETAELEAEMIAVEAIRQEDFALRDQIYQDLRRIEARTQLLREQRDRDLQMLANIGEDARARRDEDMQLLANISADARAETIEDSGVQTSGDHPLDEHITKVSVNQADHNAELSMPKCI